MKTIINLTCGLANRMFQYSYYLYLKGQGKNVCVDYYTAAKLAHEKVSWNRIFPNATLNQANSKDVILCGGGQYLVSKLRRKFLPFTCRVINMTTVFDIELPNKNWGTAYVSGVFQNAAMVESIHKQITEAFKFSPLEGEQNISLAQKIRETESVAIHVRKGKDYQALDWYKNTCDIEYYKKAVEILCRQLENPTFYVFTDNPEWVKENFSDFDYILVQGNPESGWGSHFDMQLMSLCKHNIISNSTYSWWGAYLNDNADKTVIIPKYWFNPNGQYKAPTSDKLLCKQWIQL